MQYHDEYAAINSRVHRKPALVAGSPALVRHVAFWKPGDTAREQWVAAADRYIIAVYHAIKAADTKSRTAVPRSRETLIVLNDLDEEDQGTQPPDALGPSGHGGRPRRFYLFGHVFVDDGEDIGTDNFRPIVSADAVAEKQPPFDRGRDLTTDQVPTRFRTVSFKFAYYQFTCWIKFELHHEYFSLSIVLDFSVLPTDVGLDVMRKQPPVLKLGEALETINQKTRKRFDILCRRNAAEPIGPRRQAMVDPHRLIYSEFWRDFVDQDLLETTEAKALLSQIGKVFYDTRGLILYMAEKPRDTDTSGEETGSMFSGLFPAAHSSVAIDTVRPEPFFTPDNGFDINACDAFWPFITALDKGKNDRVEYAASKFLNQRAMHITSLGNIPTAAQNVNVPVKFLLVTSLRNRWQIGRLIDRLFVLESSRVAALMNVDKLSEANRKLDEAFVALRRFQQDRSGTGVEIQNQLADFSRNLARLSGESGCDGGLEYRIGRSRYNVAQFREMMASFRVHRIEGYQTFEEFTQRRFYTIYRSIEDLGSKLIAFRHHLDDLNDQIQAEQMLELSRLNVERQEEIYGLQIVLIKLQIAAEMALILPLSYYSFHLSEGILHDLVQLPQWAIPLACLVSFSAFFWFRRRHHAKELQNKIDAQAKIKRAVNDADGTARNRPPR